MRSTNWLGQLVLLFHDVVDENGDRHRNYWWFWLCNDTGCCGASPRFHPLTLRLPIVMVFRALGHANRRYLYSMLLLRQRADSASPGSVLLGPRAVSLV
jgi:hypothetical protein